jgi:hypothetical protein
MFVATLPARSLLRSPPFPSCFASDARQREGRSQLLCPVLMPCLSIASLSVRLCKENRVRGADRCGPPSHNLPIDNSNRANKHHE